MSDYVFILRTEYEELKKCKLKSEALVRQLIMLDKAYKKKLIRRDK